MAATYVQIERSEFEDWLDTLPFQWKRDHTTVGIYLLKLSDKVAIHISSSIGSNDSVMGRGNAAIHLKMISLITDQVLNKVSVGQSRVNRTTGWRDSLKKCITNLEAAYKSKKTFYDSLAEIADRRAYREDWLSTIERLPTWSQNDFLKSLHGKISDNAILTDKQKDAILSVTFRLVNDLLTNLRSDYVYAKNKNDLYLMGIIKDIGIKLKSGERVDPKIFNDYLDTRRLG